MKKLIQPTNLLLYLLATLVFFIVGMTLAGVTGVAEEGSGLAGGAIVFSYGIGTATIALIASVFVAHKAKTATITRINNMLGILLLIAVCLLVYSMSGA